MSGDQEPGWIEPARAGADALPRPVSKRWQPLRLGLVDLFYYDDEQFWFHDGRLLLRGNNGTGKSKVLALTLPLLLDGSIQPRRVEPDADPKKRMDWNLLLGGAHPSSERTGYSWIEFGRVDADGTEHFTTLGIGLKAAAGRGIVKSWYFVSTRRIGDLRLLDQARTVLTQERLRVEVEGSGSGQVHATREAYRRAVDESLFRLGEERYAALVDLLIQLRQPQLSKRPDEKLLSAALTEALPPLDQAVVADVAESFRSLEEERAGITDVRDTLTAAQAFLEQYRVYARVAARRHTTAVRVSNSEFERAGRDLRETEASLVDAGARVEQVRRALVLAEERRSALTGRQDALRESPEMRDAERLTSAAHAAAEWEVRVGQETDEVATSRARAGREHAALATASRLHEEAVTRADGGAASGVRAAAEAGLAAEHVGIAADAEAAVRALSRRREQLTHVRSLVEVALTARARAEQLRGLLDDAEAVETGRAEDVQSGRVQVTEAIVRHRDQVHTYLATVAVLTLDAGVEDLSDLAAGWAQSMLGESPVRTAVNTAAGTALRDIGRRRAEAEQDAARLGHELAQVQARVLALEEGQDPEPAPVPGREPAVRVGAPGAPLWRLTDFVEDLPDADRAGVEAALQSAGLLDAWVFPDATVRTQGDVVLSASGAVAPAGASLAAVLVPAIGPEAPVSAQVVTEVLSRIGWGEGSAAATWVDASGGWGADPARGSWTKGRAEFIGAGAREASRRDLLIRLRAEAEHLRLEHDAAGERVETAVQQLNAAEAERDGYPVQGEHDLVAAHERERSAQRELDQARTRAQRARDVWERAGDAADEADVTLREAAAELRTGTTSAALDADREALAAYAAALKDLRAADRAVRDAAAALDIADERASEASELLSLREATLRDVRSRAAERRALADGLQETVGASVAELQQRLSAISADLAATAEDLKGLTRDQLAATSAYAALVERETQHRLRRQEAADGRISVVEALRSFCATGVLRVALPGLETPDPGAAQDWHVTAAVALSRHAEQQLEDVDESADAWSRVQQRMSSAHTELSAQMSRHGHTAVMAQQADVMVARVRYLSEEVDVDHLAGRLVEELADRERLLSAREREILENHLVNEVAGHLHELLLSAQGQIDRMNTELVERKTSTGMQLRVLWRERVDGPVGLRAARELMLRSDATWSATDRSAIGGFLQARIAEVREADATRSWQEHLEQALDYRQWHTFLVERRQNGLWRSAAGPASGGERVLAMSVPLFAAASSHYNSASPLAPRLILLDEAFAGVDDDSRAKSLGLLATFDLDVVMTSEREWGCYPQVPGLAIAQLSRVDGIDAVGVTRWRWDGARRERMGEVGETARAGAGAPDPEAGLYDGSLLG